MRPLRGRNGLESFVLMNKGILEDGMGDINSKNTAREFLKNLGSLADEKLPTPSEVKKEVDGIAKDAMSDSSKRHLRIRKVCL
jgi:hypothetical protein